MKETRVPRAWTDPLVRPQQSQRDLRFDTWNVRIQHRSGSLTKVARELTRYKLDLVSVQEFRGHFKSRGFYLFRWEMK
jgi:hypothetical protein